MVEQSPAAGAVSVRPDRPDLVPPRFAVAAFLRIDDDIGDVGWSAAHDVVDGMRKTPEELREESQILVRLARNARSDAERARKRSVDLRISADSARASSDEHRTEANAARSRQEARRPKEP
jgi:hypothetical protein